MTFSKLKKRGKRSQILVMHICILHMVFKNSEFINSMGKASPKFLNLFQHFDAQMNYIIFSFSFSMQKDSQTEIFFGPLFSKIVRNCPRIN